MSILLVVFPLLLGRVPFAVAPFVVIAASLGAATVMHILIEAPAIRLGHRQARTARPTMADTVIAGPASAD
jgi:peptidoglycan/LPS O-acetylase OafA/YrhL